VAGHLDHIKAGELHIRAFRQRVLAVESCLKFQLGAAAGADSTLARELA
jgi:hypothetical protein